MHSQRYPAPIFYLHSDETYHPSYIETHLGNTEPKIDYTPLKPTSISRLFNLNFLNGYGSGGSNVYLTAKKKVNNGGQNQQWLKGVKPVYGKTAPATIVCVDKGNGV